MSSGLTKYPDGKASNALGDKEKEKILEYSLPDICRTHMKLLMWDCTGKSQADIVIFCKKLEDFKAENGPLNSTTKYSNKVEQDYRPRSWSSPEWIRTVPIELA